MGEIQNLFISIVQTPALLVGLLAVLGLVLQKKKSCVQQSRLRHSLLSLWQRQRTRNTRMRKVSRGWKRSMQI